MSGDVEAEIEPVTRMLFPNFPDVTRTQVSFACGAVAVGIIEHEKRAGETPETKRAMERIQYILRRQADEVGVQPQSDGEEIDLIIREVLDTEDFPRLRGEE